MTPQQMLFASAAAASLLSLAAQALGGGRLIAAKVLADPSVTARYRLPFLYCWHFVSLGLAVMTAAYAALIFEPQNDALAVLLTATAMAGSALAILIASAERTSALKMPPTTLFALVAAFGAAGFVVG